MSGLKFIDVSSHQGNINVGVMLDSGIIDAVVSKATEGVGYTNPYCDGVIQAALKRGKPCGIYHFARENSAKAEADYFIKETRGYVGKCIPILDFEADALGNGVEWALDWLKRVESAYGCKPWIYMSYAVTKEHDWSPIVKNDNGLWVARYNDELGTVGHWSTVAAWQYTSSGRLQGYNGNLDVNTFFGSAEQWAKYVSNGAAAPDSEQPAEQEPETIGKTKKVKIIAEVTEV